MMNQKLRIILSEINRRAKAHPIGDLQQIRKNLKGKERLPARDLFPEQTIFDDAENRDPYAFHYGGRSELQFNIGFEHRGNLEELRYGVAFSLKPSQSLPNIEVLYPKVRLFNDFMRQHPEKYADMRMWYYQGKQGSDERKPSSDYPPTIIPPELATKGTFIVLGKRKRLSELDHESLLGDLDELLHLYISVESGGKSAPILSLTLDPFRFRPGWSTKISSTTATQAERQLDVKLIHNELQDALCRKLAKKHGEANVGAELPSGAGTSVDVVVRQNDGFWFYEIKTAHSPRACLREALGQLLEYSFWPGSKNASRLIVVGMSALDNEGVKYLQTLKQRFSLPIEYEQVVI